MKNEYILDLPEYGFAVTLPNAPQHLYRNLQGYPGIGDCDFHEFRAPPPNGHKTPDVYVEVYAAQHGATLSDATRLDWLEELTRLANSDGEEVACSTLASRKVNRIRGQGDGGLHEIRLIEGKNSVVLLNVVDTALDTAVAVSFFASFRQTAV